MNFAKHTDSTWSGKQKQRWSVALLKGYVLSIIITRLVVVINHLKNSTVHEPQPESGCNTSTPPPLPLRSSRFAGETTCFHSVTCTRASIPRHCTHLWTGWSNREIRRELITISEPRRSSTRERISRSQASRAATSQKRDCRWEGQWLQVPSN